MAKKIKHPKILVKETYWGKRITHHLANGKLHRIDGPAVIVERGQGGEEYHEWWRNGRKHRPDGPAQYNYFSEYESEEWRNKGFDPIKYGKYYYKGKLMSESEFYGDERKGIRRSGLLTSLLR